MPWLIALFVPWNAACTIFVAMNCANLRNNPIRPAACSIGWKNSIWSVTLTSGYKCATYATGIVHDYLPEQTAQMYSEISGPYGKELQHVRGLLG